MPLRFWSDPDGSRYHRAYKDAILDAKTKELLGLVARRCSARTIAFTDHVVRAGEVGSVRAQVIDALHVALMVDGSITIPQVRRAFDRMRSIPGLRTEVK